MSEYWKAYFPYIRTLGKDDIGKEIMRVDYEKYNTGLGLIMKLIDIEINKKCAVCGTESINKCSICKVKYYCSQTCQKNDWKRHKQTCRKGNNHMLCLRLKYDSNVRYDLCEKLYGFVVLDEVKHITLPLNPNIINDLVNPPPQINVFLNVKFKITEDIVKVDLRKLRNIVYSLSLFDMENTDSIIEKYATGVFTEGDVYNNIKNHPNVSIFAAYLENSCTDPNCAIHGIKTKPEWVTELDKIEDEQTKENPCVICYENKPILVAVPCGHKNICKSCAIKLYNDGNN